MVGVTSPRLSSACWPAQLQTIQTTLVAPLFEHTEELDRPTSLSGDSGLRCERAEPVDGFVDRLDPEDVIVAAAPEALADAVDDQNERGNLETAPPSPGRRRGERQCSQPVISNTSDAAAIRLFSGFMQEMEPFQRSKIQGVKEMLPAPSVQQLEL